MGEPRPRRPRAALACLAAALALAAAVALAPPSARTRLVDTLKGAGVGIGKTAPSPLPSTDTSAVCGDAALRDANADLAPLLAHLVATPFFRFFKARLDGECPFWQDDGQCSLADCAVCACGAADLPPRLAAQCARGAPPSQLGACAALAASPVDRGLGSATDAARLVAVPGWRGYDNPWMADGGESELVAGRGDDDDEKEDDDDSSSSPAKTTTYSVIDLSKNPERYTGYKGDHARRVWAFIYGQDCFPSGGEAATRGASSQLQCDPAKAAFFRIMSGVHASITAHLADEFPLGDGEWGPNLALFSERLGGPDNAPRVANLHFAYAFLARAVARAGPLLASADYDDGGAGHGATETALVKALVSHPALARVCGAPFDSALASRDAARDASLQAAFRNVTAAMDCVGCEKCRLWGKLQLLGVATALKVLVVGRASGRATHRRLCLLPPPPHPGTQ